MFHERCNPAPTFSSEDEKKARSLSYTEASERFFNGVGSYFTNKN